MVNLFTTDSYFNMFNLLIESLREKGNSIDKKNVIFCEEKISLMIERRLCQEFGGSFNTEVYSFGNFLRAKKPMDNLLTLEGSAMAVKRILSTVKLNCFKASKQSLAPTLYNLFIQLKSAKVSPEDIFSAIDKTDGILQSKLKDVFTIFDSYEKFIKENKFEDQSSYLSYLPQLIAQTECLNGANVYIVGFSGLTKQICSAISALLERTNNLTAILCEGDNPLVFVNESCEFIRKLCKEKNYPLIDKKIKSEYNAYAKVMLDGMFNPFLINEKKLDYQSETEGVYYSAMPSAISEIERIAQIIKDKVIKGECRYKDITIAIADGSYNGYIERIFKNFEIPYFIDERKKVSHHPLIRLILSYIDIFRKNFERKSIIAFIKNPYFCQDKQLADNFENYIIKYNINFLKIKQPFVFSENEDVDSLNSIRERLIALFEKFDVLSLLEKLGAKELTERFCEQLKELGEFEESAISAQMFDLTVNLLRQIQLLLGGLKLSLTEYRNIFYSGVSAMEMSIIPQYNDAVFIGEYKQTALAKAKHLFAIGLTSAVPNVQADVSLLSDDDICALEEIKVLVEPKINIVNKRIRENVALALCAFDKSLYISYPICSVDGTKNVNSEVVSNILNAVKTKDFPMENGYLTKKQGLKTFARECGEFADSENLDFENASSYYMATYDDKVKKIVESANKEIKERLLSSKEILISKETSPTTIEDYYACPYKAFLSRAIRLKKRDEGFMDHLSIGNIMHSIFNVFVNRINEVSDKLSSDKLFNEIKEKVLGGETKYKKFLAESSNQMMLERVLIECKKYCYKTYLSIKNSSFSSYKSEIKFGDNQFYPAIPLSNGQIKIKGTIDRVDESDNYFRVVDYKTGKTDSSEKSIFAGIKLQLLLYGAAVSNKYDHKKQIAGLYYLPISDKYLKPDEKVSPMADGYTLDDKTAILEQENDFFDDRLSEFMPIKLDQNGNVKNTINKEQLDDYINYALAVSELAVEQLKEGIIVASPYNNTCEHCEFKGICNDSLVNVRELDGVKMQTIIDAEKGEGQDG